MSHFQLFQRKTIYVPTLLGFVSIFTGLFLVLFLLIFQLQPFLAPQNPVQNARILVVEGWMDDYELNQIIEWVEKKPYTLIVTTGSVIEAKYDLCGFKTYAERSANYLKDKTKIPVMAVTAPPSAQDRTFLSAVYVREWLKTSNIVVKAFDLFSANVHAKRSHVVYKMAFDNQIEIGILSAKPKDYDYVHWWTTSIGVKSTIGEILSLAWTKCCFFKPKENSHEEKWGKSSYK